MKRIHFGSVDLLVFCLLRYLSVGQSPVKSVKFSFQKIGTLFGAGYSFLHSLRLHLRSRLMVVPQVVLFKSSY